MGGDHDVQSRFQSAFGHAVVDHSSECHDANQRKWNGAPAAFPYHSDAERAYREDDFDEADGLEDAHELNRAGGSDETGTDGPSWFWNALAGWGLNPLTLGGIRSAVADGIINAAADAGGKGGNAKAKKKTEPAPAAPKKAGRAVLSKEEWLERIRYFLYMGRNHVAYSARYPGDRGKVKRATLIRNVKNYLDEQAKQGASPQAPVSWNNDWFAPNRTSKPGGKP